MKLSFIIIFSFTDIFFRKYHWLNINCGSDSEKDINPNRSTRKWGQIIKSIKTSAPLLSSHGVWDTDKTKIYVSIAHAEESKLRKSLVNPQKPTNEEKNKNDCHTRADDDPNCYGVKITKLRNSSSDVWADIEQKSTSKSARTH